MAHNIHAPRIAIGIKTAFIEYWLICCAKTIALPPTMACAKFIGTPIPRHLTARGKAETKYAERVEKYKPIPMEQPNIERYVPLKESIPPKKKKPAEHIVKTTPHCIIMEKLRCQRIESMPPTKVANKSIVDIWIYNLLHVASPYVYLR